MYSIVLMAALSTGGDVSACHRGGCGGGGHGFCGGGHGFCGGRSHGFCGGGHGCYGASYNCGCCGAPVYNSCGCCGASAADCCGTTEPVKEKDEDDDADEMDKDVRAAAPAKLIVNLPAGAKLTIDGAATKSTSARRVFVSPTLASGKTFVYTLTAEVNNKTITKKVDVRAGKTITVELNSAAVASR